MSRKLNLNIYWQELTSLCSLNLLLMAQFVNIKFFFKIYYVFIRLLIFCIIFEIF